jgi:hypothetical protein
VVPTLTLEPKGSTTLGRFENIPAMADPMAAPFPDPLNLGLGENPNHPKGSAAHHRGRIHSVIQSPQPGAVITPKKISEVTVEAGRPGEAIKAGDYQLRGLAFFEHR